MSQSITQKQKQSSNEAPGAQVQRWAEWLDQKFQEREVTIRLALLAVCARQHLLLLGPPGTAKTLLARRVTDAMQGRWFTTLLTKFSAPEDVFGPLSLPRLEQGVYERLTAGYFPDADFDSPIATRLMVFSIAMLAAATQFILTAFLGAIMDVGRDAASR